MTSDKGRYGGGSDAGSRYLFKKNEIRECKRLIVWD